DRYFDVFIEYAKAAFEDICIRITVINRGPASAPLELLPTIWFRNTWSWSAGEPKPHLSKQGEGLIACSHPVLGQRKLLCESPDELLFTENETNYQRLYGSPNPSPQVKDGIHNYIVHGDSTAVNPLHTGTKASARYHLDLPPGGTAVAHLRLTNADPTFDDFDQVFARRLAEADEFYATLAPKQISKDARLVQRQAFAGLLWSKQFYYYDVKTWLRGDPAMPPPPPERANGRNHDWMHLYNSDVISMPDKWEYPWYAAWDLAFHCI